MKLYYGKGSCSLAPNIALREAGLKFTLDAVDLKTKNYSGGDFTKKNPKGYVPVLELDNDLLLTEAAVILEYIADQAPDRNLLPAHGSFERYRAKEWLNYIATELHKGMGPLWKETTPEAFKEVTRSLINHKFQFLDKHFANNEFLMGNQLTVADCYLFTVLNWTRALQIDLEPHSSLLSYFKRMRQRPAVQEALVAEGLKV